MSENIKNKELDTNELQKVTGGFQVTYEQLKSLAYGNCLACDYPNKGTECIDYLFSILDKFTPGSTVDVTCPQGKTPIL